MKSPCDVEYSHRLPGSPDDQKDAEIRPLTRPAAHAGTCRAAADDGNRGGQRVAPVSRQSAADGRLGQHSPGDAQAVVDLRGRRRHRFVSGDRGRRGLRGRRQRRSDRARPGVGQAPLEIFGERQPDRRIVPSGRIGRRLRRRPGRDLSCGRRARRQGRSGRSRPGRRSSLRRSSSKTSFSSAPTTATSMRSRRAPAVLRWKVLTKGMVHATPAVKDGLAFVAGCDAVFRAIRIADGTRGVPNRIRRIHRLVACPGRRSRVLRHLRLRSAGTRLETPHSAVAVLPDGRAVSRTTRRPRSATVG